MVQRVSHTPLPLPVDATHSHILNQAHAILKPLWHCLSLYRAWRLVAVSFAARHPTHRDHSEEEADLAISVSGRGRAGCNALGRTATHSEFVTRTRCKAGVGVQPMQ